MFVWLRDVMESSRSLGPGDRSVDRRWIMVRPLILVGMLVLTRSDDFVVQGFLGFLFSLRKAFF